MRQRNFLQSLPSLSRKRKTTVTAEDQDLGPMGSEKKSTKKSSRTEEVDATEQARKEQEGILLARFQYESTRKAVPKTSVPTVTAVSIGATGGIPSLPSGSQDMDVDCDDEPSEDEVDQPEQGDEQEQ